MAYRFNERAPETAEKTQMDARPPNPQRLRLRDLTNLPGFFTLARLPLAVVYPFFAANLQAAFALWLLAGLTDFLDGFLARRFKQESHTGAVLDGWLDKVFWVNSAWSLVVFHDVPGIWLLAWFSREIVQAIMIPFLVGRFVEGRVRAHYASFLGKLTTWMLAFAFLAVFVGQLQITAILTPIIGTTGFLSALDYLRREIRDAREIQRNLERSVEPIVRPALEPPVPAR
jgi:cardiolipin synthase